MKTAPSELDLLLQVQGMIAEYERARILERGRGGRRHAALSGAVSAMCAMPYGYRYIGRHAGGGVARIEVMEDEARVVRQLFAWISIERISLREAGRRLQAMGCPTRTGLGHWDATTIAGMLRNEPRHLVTWLRHPQQVVPGNAMPEMGLDERDARDIAAYLYTLR